MSSPLRILCLENDLADAELVQDTLETEGIACKLTRVEAECDFRVALQQGGFDLILADYTLPSFDGLSALRMVGQQLPDVPFIFVSGTLGEEVAIEALKMGATDYVFKTRLSRLVPAVQRALREVAERAERQKAEEAVRRNERELRQVIETIPAMVWTALPDGSNASINSRWMEYTGSSATGLGWQSAVHPDDLKRHMDVFFASSAAGLPLEGEVRFRRVDGEYRWFLVQGMPLRDEQGNILKWYGIVTDIEDRKRAEALLAGEKRIHEMVAKGDSLPEILNSLCRLVEEQASGTRASILLVEGGRLLHGGAPSLPKEYVEAIDGVVIGPEVGSCGTAAYFRKQVIVEDIATDRSWTNYRAAALPHSLRACWSTPIFSSAGKVIGTFAMYYPEPRRPSKRDQEIIEQITHLAGVAIERKMTLEQLQRSEAYLAEAQRLAHTGSWAWNPLTEQCFYWSEEMFRIYALDPRQGLPTSETFWQRIHPEDRESMHDLLRKSALEKAEYAHDHQIVLLDGTIKHIHAIGHPVLDEAGELVEYVGTAVDVTERKRAEESLALRSFALNNVREAAFLVDEDARFRYVNEEACRVLGYTREELLRMDLHAINPDFPADRWPAYWADLKSNRSLTFEGLHRARDGRLFPVEISANYFEYGGRAYNLALVRDISERKQAEEVRLEARVAERTRIARDLHDTLLQSFQALLPRFQAAIYKLPHGATDARKILEEAVDQASLAITEGRDAVQALRMSTGEKNLAVAIRTLGEELASAETNKSATQFEVIVEGANRNLYPTLRDEVYLIAAEALRNAFRHAAARNVEVEIRYDEEYFRLRVRDDGKGIGPEVLRAAGREGHYGLHGMRERAELVGGKLTIWTELNSGAQIELNIPGARAYVKSTRPFWYFGKRSATDTDEKETIERE